MGGVSASVLLVVGVFYQGSMNKTHRALVGRKAAAPLVRRKPRVPEEPARRLRASVIGSDH
ncbi:hypothetical protein CU669_04920 [Paramagnetospirillum kuznetsovii]|uniref:Uncharacterized protein n=1 Tax=Paramagnetospirillum kuznetsovii TaxID=2053833 RepID=A0A364P2F4_9PROT|nr:hypothetical protein CU669_04920 [Paramagnetospirillum kuznetsovii]